MKTLRTGFYTLLLIGLAWPALAQSLTNVPSSFDPPVIVSDAPKAGAVAPADGNADPAAAAPETTAATPACVCPPAEPTTSSAPPPPTSLELAIRNAFEDERVPQNRLDELTCAELNEVKDIVWARHGFYFEDEAKRTALADRYDTFYVPLLHVTTDTIGRYKTTNDKLNLLLLGAAAYAKGCHRLPAPAPAPAPATTPAPAR